MHIERETAEHTAHNAPPSGSAQCSSCCWRTSLFSPLKRTLLTRKRFIFLKFEDKLRFLL